MAKAVNAESGGPKGQASLSLRKKFICRAHQICYMPKNKKVRVRFAPSPTGFLHVGSLRTALYNFLFARQKGGDFILRIEDTDRTRLVDGATECLLKILTTAGLDWDEGPMSNGKEKGKFGPYIQSERTKIYKKYAEKLIEKGQAYHCFCSAERLEKLRETQQANKLPTMYDGLCRSLDKSVIAKSLKENQPHVIRLTVPKEGNTNFNDVVRGAVAFENKLIDDQVLVKSDGFPTYHLANVVDDHLMEITDVIRGEEWLSSTPKHILLYQAFGWTPPRFAHIPLLLNPDKSKLSKRQGDVAAEDYLKKGYLPEALINFVALLGWNPGTEQEIFSLPELIKYFDITKVQKAGAVFNVEKLNWMNGEYIKKMAVDELVKKCLPYLKDANYDLDKIGKEKLEKIVRLEQERMKKLTDLPLAVEFFFKEPQYDAKILVWKKSLELIEKENLANGPTLWPMRVALSGREASPGPFAIAGILGKGETIKRLKIALNLLCGK
ncbi:MAG: Glutamate-tRNA ligase [Candidatus Magasanikbacteria bacterium GW2011_GWA2_42_32]|uniref:Glutamate--tRNA ligase n=1 Tax=Candidatus Magasanikbacteria bacterium GW2011_GWA2_42_32 TaxID=1619039 RepID=A0A0G1A624_9BACT|nr:MAG: Glutamate-tRNA ligase [Candidatus Magasanikbacteria bacterium GW2011_GWA2_42_32]